jgi:hypothetical protein
MTQSNISTDVPGRKEVLLVSGVDWPREFGSHGRFIKDKREHPYSKEHSLWEYSFALHNKETVPHLFYFYENDPYSAKAYGLPSQSFDNESNTISNLTLTALNRMADRVRNSELQLGNDIGEAKQTFQMIGDKINTITSAIRHLKRGDFSYAQRALGITDRKRLPKRLRKKQLISKYSRQGIDGLSSAWLELQFGWKPLLSEIKSGYDLMRSSEQNKATKGVEGFNLLKTKSSASTSFSDPFVAGNVTWIRKKIYRINYRFYYEKKVPTVANTNTRLGLDNPFGVLWEITPWSFLIDYFIPIGDYIAAKEFLNKNPPLFAWKTEVIHFTSKATSSNTNILTGIDSKYSSTSILRKQTTVDELLGGVPFPKPKPFSEVFSVAHVLNAIALLGQTLKK